MTGVIRKKDLAARVAGAASSTPSLDDRLRHAEELAHAHPAPEVPLVSTGLAVVPTVTSTPLPVVIAGPAATRKRFMTVDIHLVDENPFNARKIYRPERVAQIGASIKAHGQDTPGTATERNGRFILASAHYRRRGILQAGLPTIDLMVYEGLTDKELFEYSYRENIEREDQSPLDNALSWADLLQSGVYANETELAQAVGMSLPNVNKTMKILDLSACVLDVVREAPAAFALSALYELALYERAAGEKGAAVAAELARQLLEEKIGRKEIQEARARIEQPKDRKRKETSRPYRIERDGAYSGSLKVFGDSGRVTLDLVFTDPRVREEALSELKAKFGVAE